MSKQSELVGLARTTNLDEVNAAYSAGALSNRNVILNGAMNVAQRGTSFTASGYTLDRWRSVADTAIVTQKVEDTVGGKKVAVLQSVATSGHTYHAVIQRIEGMRRIQGQTLTLSAWVKGSAGTFAQYVEFRNATGNVVLGISFNFTFTGNWQKLEWTFAAPTATAFDDDAAWYNVSFYAGDSLSLTMVQLEVGDTATPFEHRSYGQELALCKRYFQIFKEDGVVTTFSAVVAYNTTAAYDGPQHIFPVEMRAVPTRSESGSFAASDGLGGSIAITSFGSNVNRWGYVLGFGVASGLTAGKLYFVRAAAASGSTLKFDAEL